MSDEEDRELSGDDWREYFDEGSSFGLVCNTCCALVAPQPEFAFGHIAWHRRQRSQLEQRHRLL